MVRQNVKPESLLLKPRISLLVLIIVVALAAAAVLFVYFYEPGEKVVATVNGEAITRDELYDAMVKAVGTEVVDHLILFRLIEQEAERLEITVSAQDVDDDIDRIIQEDFFGKEDELLNLLAQYNYTLDDFKEQRRVDLLAEKIALTRVEISEQDIENYFKEHQDQYNIEEEVEVRHILVSSEEEAQEIIDLLEEGADFAELASEHSTDTWSAEKGGNLGFIRKGEMGAEFEEAAFGMAAGERSGPVATQYGYHIIEVLNRREAKEVTLDEVKDRVKDDLTEQKVSEAIEEMIRSLQDEAEITNKLKPEA